MNVCLVMFKDDGTRKEFPVQPGKTLIGRKEDCDLRIPVGEVSRQHALMMVEDDTVTLRDLGSSNGTYVNNKRITEQELDPGDHIVIGPVVFTVQIDGVPKDLRPVHTRLESRAGRSSATPVTAQGSSGGSNPSGADDDDFLLDDDVDPISELEALAASDETAALDLEDSDLV
ncbi:MAG TPA: FHA domain-containing protein [Phycisphaerae bacterium]|nr:FHA domain-containing protein [Phycisphaerae bacterium]HON68686.1 FHA domain-containing protein [Phycisphaerae bacterium]HOQ87643.1 FHA domain-containing protein [Phycisphaerae bacterium]HPP28276.1 FHA domain-containing protein [Phycisphaerae bacterium]HPU27741.1 FHA domain-containing protein [Phycisphaerae bacterium]